MIIVPEPCSCTGLPSKEYEGKSSQVIFTKAKLHLCKQSEKWRHTFHSLLSEDGIEVVRGTPAASHGPGGVCAVIQVRCEAGLHENEEFYTAEFVQDNQVVIVGASPAACFWGFQTARQVFRQARSTFEEVIHVQDMPCFVHRGVLLDISRDRVPSMPELKRIIRILSSLKFNHLQLYMEHTFAYRGHERVWENASALTAAQIQELDQYCAAYCITLVPCQNTLGHMHRWLEHKEYSALAEIPEGVFHPFSEKKEPFSLCPSDQRVETLVRSLLEELVPQFETNLESPTPLVNVNLDEAFDLGRRKSRTKGNKGKVIASYSAKMNAIVERLGARMMMWADGVNKKNLPLIPQECVLIEWGYEDGHPWKSRLRTLSSKGHEVWVAPGTSSWCSVSGRTENALHNLHQTSLQGFRHGAKGFLITDWGDYGHHQQPCISYIGFVTGGAKAWRAATDNASGLFCEQDITAFCDLLGLFSNERLAAAAFRLGNVYKLVPQLPNMSFLWLALAIPESLQENHLIQFAVETFTILPYPQRLLRAIGPVFNFFFTRFVLSKKKLFKVKSEIERIKLDCLFGNPKDDWEFQQLLFTTDFLQCLTDVWLFRCKKGVHVPANKCSFDLEEFASVARNYRHLWEKCACPGGLQDSVAKLNRMVGVDVVSYSPGVDVLSS